MTETDLQTIYEALISAQAYIADDMDAIEDEEYYNKAENALEQVNKALELFQSRQ